MFYKLLPLAAPLLVLAGKDGRAWMKGINRALNAVLSGHYPTKF
jgi:hypothetical protein